MRAGFGWIIFSAALSVLAAGAVANAQEASKKRPNVVFILADDLGYTDLSCYGSKYYETPHIDRVASQGVRFTDGYSCGPNCQPTRAALNSGQYGPRTGVYTVGGIDRFDWQSRPLRPVDNVAKLPLDVVTLAQSLKQSGYATGMFGKWHLGNDAAHHPSKRGFDEALVTEGKHFGFETTPKVEYESGTYLADFLTDKATDFIKRHKDEPFYLYLPHYGVHAPHDAKPDLIERFKSKVPVGGHKNPTYAAMIASVDESVGKITTLLDELHLSEDTLVIFSSDNGGVGGYEQHGIQGNSITDNAPLHGGKGMLYDGGIRVPYIFRWPGVIPSGQTSGTPINSVDLYPTLLDVTGASPPNDQKLDGVSYSAVLREPSRKLERDLYWHFPGYLGAGAGTWRTTPAGAIRSGDWKLIEFFEDGRLELYNLADDISESNNLSESNPAKAKELQEKLTQWRSEVGAKLPTRNAEIEPATKAKKGKGKKGKQKA